LILDILVAILLFGFMIFIHEFGHYITAKMFGVTVHEFAVGMGPAIFKKKIKETTYSLRILPLGGYTAMAEDEEDNDDPNGFNKKSWWKRFIILFAGSFMNLLCGLIVVMIMLLTNGSDLVGTPTIHSFRENAVSCETGLMAGDTVVSVNGYRVLIYSDIAFAVSLENQESYTIVVDRKNESGKTERLTLENVRFPRTTIEDGGDKLYSYPDIIYLGVPKNIGNIITSTFGETISVVRTVYKSLLYMITGKVDFAEVSGPVGITEAVGEAVQTARKTHDFTMVFSLFKMLTINLGVMNLLPIPALDGGRILFVLVEAVIRKPINKKYEGIIHLVGMALLLILMAVVAVNDLIKIFS